MNRPTNAPCWLVYVWLDGRRLWLRDPSSVQELLHYGTRANQRPIRFTTRQVEPFVSEIDAIAAALILDGGVRRVEADEDET